MFCRYWRAIVNNIFRPYVNSTIKFHSNKSFSPTCPQSRQMVTVVIVFLMKTWTFVVCLGEIHPLSTHSTCFLRDIIKLAIPIHSKFESFCEGLFSYIMWSFVKIKSSRNHSVVYWYRYIMPKSWIFKVANRSLDAIRENKILTKIFGFTVTHGSRYRPRNILK